LRVWVAGRKEAATRRAARYGDVWIPYMVTPELLADGLERLRREAAAIGRAEPVAGALFAWLAVDRDGDAARRTVVEAASAAYGQDFSRLAARYLVAGTPAEVRRRLDEFRAAGAGAAIVQLAAPPDGRDRALRLLAEEVVPSFR
jgi:alkanesulfonate monooxygenase SsuD/methylene tetrahydromethanopterin reductase-like flavin-dependent oxidoreductase (luciferase family)